MYKLRHPQSEAVYSNDPDGLVRVEHDEQWGLFTFNGEWVSGEIRVADPEMCRWVASRVQIQSGTSRDRVSAFRGIDAATLLARTRKESS